MRVYSFTDLRFTGSQTPTGVGKHMVHMVRGLAECSDTKVSVLATRDQLDDSGRTPVTNALSSLPVAPLPFSNNCLEGLWTLTARPLADRWCSDADWIYCPKNDFVPTRDIKVAATIHGAAPLDPALPQLRGVKSHIDRLRWGRVYHQIAKRADLILTVSDFLKNQVIEWFNAEPSKIVNVGNGVEEEYFSAATLPVGSSGRKHDQPFV